MRRRALTSLALLLVPSLLPGVPARAQQPAPGDMLANDIVVTGRGLDPALPVLPEATATSAARAAAQAKEKGGAAKLLRLF
jgi:hypothetical protein